MKGADAIAYLVGVIILFIALSAVTEGLFILQQDNVTIPAAHECIEAQRNHVGEAAMTYTCTVQLARPSGVFILSPVAQPPLSIEFEIPSIHLGDVFN